MDDTGRIREPLLPSIRRVLFARTPGDTADLWAITEIDRAHLVMLSERGIVSPVSAGTLLRAIARLRETAFAALKDTDARRGLYLMYEDHLIATESIRVAGILQTARSRNDLQATVLRLRLRGPIGDLLTQGLRLLAILLRRAARHVTAVMPMYTHAQPALPSTYGHYLAGVARALVRELAAFVTAADDLDECPLGAGAVAGSTLPIDTDRTANLLGFGGAIDNAIDAVASRDVALRLLASATSLGVLLSRVASDVLRWCGPEFGFLRLPDCVVGSSSAMPQKRNPFLLEHVQGRSAAPLGAFVAAASAMHAAPFSHAIAVGTEAMRPVYGALADTTDAVRLLRLVLMKAVPDREAMRRRTAGLHITAMELAHEIMRGHDLDFRSAHHLVGSALTDAQDADGGCSPERVAALLASRGFAVDVTRAEADAVVAAAAFGGGPAPASVRRSLQSTRTAASAIALRLRAWRRQWADGHARLDAVCTQLACGDAATLA